MHEMPPGGFSLLSLTLFCLAGVSAALIFQQEVQAPSTPLRVVFDGDAVLFSDETDKVFREQGLEGAMQYERAMEAVPMGEVSKPPHFSWAPTSSAPTMSISPSRAFPQVAKKAQVLKGSLCIHHSVPGVGLIWSPTGDGSGLSPISEHQLPNIQGCGYPQHHLLQAGTSCCANPCRTQTQRHCSLECTFLVILGLG